MRLRPRQPADRDSGPDCVSRTIALPAFMYAGAANDGLHNAIPNVFWWAWNANSGEWRYMPTSMQCTTLHILQDSAAWAPARLMLHMQTLCERAGAIS